MQLRDFQVRAVQRIITSDAVGLFADMGSGKTASVLTGLRELRRAGLVGRVLVIAPLRVATSVWRQEIAKWPHLSDLTVAMAIGKAAERMAAAQDTDKDILLINVDNLKWLVEEVFEKQLAPWPDMVVVDESSGFKNAQTQRFKAIKKVLLWAGRRVIMTGTPRPNGLEELWPQCFILDDGATLGRSFYRFRERFFYNPPYSYDWLPFKDSEEKITELIRPLVMRITADEMGELPELIYTETRVQLPPAARRMYRDMEANYVAAAADTNVLAGNAAVAFGKCHQIANGAVYAGEGLDRVVTKVHDEKLEALKELLEQVDTPALVVYSYKHDLARLRAAYPEAPVLGGEGGSATQQMRTIDEWNAGRHPVLLIHARSAGHGLNLQGGGRHIIFFSMTPSLELHDQVIARIGPARRRGATTPTMAHYILAENTVDEDILTVLRARSEGQSALLDALRDRATERAAA